MNPRQLREERAKLIAEARALVEKATAESRDMSSDEDSQFDKMLAEADTLKAKIDCAEKLEAEERELAQSQGTVAGQQDAGAEDGPDDLGAESRGDPAGEEHRMASFARFLRGGVGVLDGVERRALQADSDEAGGFLVPPQSFVNQLIKAVDDLVFIRGLATRHAMAKAESLGAPSLDADPADADWTTEILTGSEGSRHPDRKSHKPCSRVRN